MVSLVGGLPVLFGQGVPKSRALEHSHFGLDDDVYFYRFKVNNSRRCSKAVADELNLERSSSRSW